MIETGTLNWEIVPLELEIDYWIDIGLDGVTGTNYYNEYTSAFESIVDTSHILIPHFSNVKNEDRVNIELSYEKLGLVFIDNNIKLNFLVAVIFSPIIL